MRNYGLLQEKEANSKDWVLGRATGIVPEVLQPDRDWSDYLPVYEPQWKGFDTYSCVTYASLNCLEGVYKRKYGIEENFSDRFTAKMSGTRPNGNTFSNVANSIVDDGVVAEKAWPFSDDIKNWNEYMSDIPQEIIDRGKESLNKYHIQWAWAGNTPMYDALQYAPLLVGVHAWEKPVNGIYQRTSKAKNHGVMVFYAKENEYWLIYDHYSKSIKKLAWDFWFGSRLQYNIEDYMPKKFEDNLLVQNVQGDGSFGMTLDGKLMIGDLDKLLATWAVRNKGDVKGKTDDLTKDEWDGLTKINFKKENI